MREVNVGVIGFGTVGAGVVSCLLDNGAAIAKRTGIKFTLARVADIDITTPRGVNVPAEALTTDAHDLIRNVDVVVELVGGTTIAKDFILEALRAGKPVVTANKALLAEHGEEIFAVAEKSKADIYYEASVAGGIPIIKSLREGLVGNRIESIIGILNGTCNYILTRMREDREEFDKVLAEARKLGYAEADPSLDIDGIDTAHKAVILASLAYGEWFGMGAVHIEGIRGIAIEDIRSADELGYCVKLLAIIKQVGEDVQIRVHPALVPKDAILADTDDVFNGVYVKGWPVGQQLYYGRGAGRDATASAVVADIVDVGLNLKFGSHRRVPAFRIGRQFGRLLKMEEVSTRYYLRLQVLEKPGVVSRVTAILAEEQISISSLLQREKQSADNVALIIITHLTKELNISRAIARIERLDVVKEKVKVIRIEDC